MRTPRNTFPGQGNNKTIPDRERKYFKEAYETGQHGWPVAEPSLYVDRFLGFLISRGVRGRLLDLGCGEGRHCILAARMGFLDVHGIDSEVLAIQRARSFASRDKVDRNIHLVVGNVYHMPYRSDSFDIIIDYGCLHHQRKPYWPGYLRNATRVLKPDGYLVLSAFSPGFGLFTDEDRQRKWHVRLGAYRRAFTERDIRGLFCDLFDILFLEEEQGQFYHALMRVHKKA